MRFIILRVFKMNNIAILFSILVLCNVGFKSCVRAHPSKFTVEKDNATVIIKFDGLNKIDFTNWNKTYNTTLHLDDIFKHLINGSNIHSDKSTVT